MIYKQARRAYETVRSYVRALHGECDTIERDECEYEAIEPLAARYVEACHAQLVRSREDKERVVDASLEEARQWR